MIENRARLRIIRPGKKSPHTNVVSFRPREERVIDVSNAMEPELRSGWIRFLKDLSPEEADVMWRVLMDETDAAIADALGISIDEVHGIMDQASSKIGGQISG